jgi:F0F1-type ATP synthase membrane subunit c/vacuolar-type H+-ATPase subunit K
MITHELSHLLHYSTIAFSICATSLGVGIGEGIACQAAIEAINIQPGSKNDISRISIIGMALIETAAIMGMTMAAILLLDTNSPITQFSGIAELGIAFAICISGLVLGLVSALPAQQAVLAIARQPFFSQQIFRFMIITQSIIQTPIIFGFIIAILIKSQTSAVTSLADSLRLLASGLAIGLGSVGPAIGLAQFASTACRGIGINPQAYTKLFSFTFISQAIIETPVIFSLIISILLIMSPIKDGNLLHGLAMLSAALCIGLGTIGAGIASGNTAAAACHQIALNPEKYAPLSRISLFAQGLIDTNAIYALLIALLLLFFK